MVQLWDADELGADHLMGEVSADGVQLRERRGGGASLYLSTFVIGCELDGHKAPLPVHAGGGMFFFTREVNVLQRETPGVRGNV